MEALAEGYLGMKGVSRIVGEARGADGVSRPLYEALRQLICSSCGAAILPGASFTRHDTGFGAGAVLPRCGKCAPHEPHTGQQSGLLQALLKPESAGPGEGVLDAERARAVEERLGPALARSRRRGSGG